MTALIQTAAADPIWQLTMDFSEEGGLNLISAKPVSPEKINPRTPNGQGGYYKIPVRIDWLDAGGRISSSADTVLPLGIRMPASETSEAPGMLLPNQVFVLRIPGPAPGIADKVRVSRVEDLRKNAAAEAGPHLNGDYIFSLDPGFVPKSSPPPGPVSSTKIRDTGANGKRLVLVFLGDGYTQAELDSGKYANNVESTLAAFASASPWNQMLKASNVYRVDVASNQSGADYENAPPETGGTVKDTYFDTGFYSGTYPYRIERLLTPSAAGQSRAITAADNMVGVGVWDQIVIVVNSSKYGGAGGFLAVNSTHQSGPLISVHEVGHSIAGLADEYEGYELAYSGQPVTEPNVDVNGASPKWSLWIDSPVPPLPTPETSTYSNTVGAFEGARYYPSGIFRPWRSCRMRDLNSAFCPVCKEQHLKSFFSIVPFTDSVSPAAASTASVTTSQTFTVGTIPLDEISYEWTLGGTKIVGAVFASLPLSTAQLPAPSQQLSVTARYSSAMMRSGAPQDSFSWTVKNNGITPAGTPHWWLASNRLGVTAGEDQIDHDGDGFATCSEYIAGTDPNDRESVLKFSTANIAPTGGSLQFPTLPGHSYRLECGTELDDWQAVTGYENIDGSVGSVTYNLPQSSVSSRFYRIAVWIP